MSTKIKCIIVDDEKVAREILESHLSRIDSVDVVASCKNAIEAFQAITAHKVDLAFLDINMPEVDGLAFARAAGHDLNIIFTTAYRDYAVEGFNLQAVDYLLKPISMERLMQAITKFMEGKAPRQEDTRLPEPGIDAGYFFVRSERKMIKINFNDILYIESIGDYIKIHLQDKTVISRESLTAIEKEIPPDRFLRIHRSYIVSLDRIDSFTNDDIEIGNMEIPISRSYKSLVLNALQRKSDSR